MMSWYTWLTYLQQMYGTLCYVTLLGEKVTPELHRIAVIPCQINIWFPLTHSDGVEIWHSCVNCLETNIRQVVFI